MVFNSVLCGDKSSDDELSNDESSDDESCDDKSYDNSCISYHFHDIQSFILKSAETITQNIQLCIKITGNLIYTGI